MPDEDQARMFEADVMRRLEACGISRQDIALQYSDQIQDYEFVIGSGPLRQAQMEQLVREVGQLVALVFDEPENTRLHMNVVMANTRASLQRQAAAMPGLPIFDPNKSTLPDFLREIEAYCGVEPGSVLELLGDRQVTLRNDPPNASVQEIALRGRVMHAAVLALVETDTQVVIVGGT